MLFSKEVSSALLACLLLLEVFAKLFSLMFVWPKWARFGLKCWPKGHLFFFYSLDLQNCYICYFLIILVVNYKGYFLQVQCLNLSRSAINLNLWSFADHGLLGTVFGLDSCNQGLFYSDHFPRYWPIGFGLLVESPGLKGSFHSLWFLFLRCCCCSFCVTCFQHNTYCTSGVFAERDSCYHKGAGGAFSSTNVTINIGNHQEFRIPTNPIHISRGKEWIK
jgi:hypothetical protein